MAAAMLIVHRYISERCVDVYEIQKSCELKSCCFLFLVIESTLFVGKRLASIGVDNVEEHRRQGASTSPT
jgi:hypothetical protein